LQHVKIFSTQQHFQPYKHSHTDRHIHRQTDRHIQRQTDRDRKTKLRDTLVSNYTFGDKAQGCERTYKNVNRDTSEKSTMLRFKNVNGYKDVKEAQGCKQIVWINITFYTVLLEVLSRPIT